MKPNHTALLRALLESGNSLAAALGQIRQQGAGLDDSIQAIRDLKLMTRQNAPYAVMNSPAWRDYRDEIARMAAKVLASNDE